MASVQQNLLSFSFVLANGNFEGGGNTATVSGLRASCTIIKVGLPASGTMQAAVFGLPLSMMNKLTTLGRQLYAQGANKISVQAGSVGGPMTTVFEGSIWDAFMDGQAMPDVTFRFNATADGYHRVAPAASTSVAGAGDVATIMKQLATQMGLQFEGNGISIKIANPYLSGSLSAQAAQLAHAAGVQMIIDKGTLAIWKAGTSRAGGPAVISKDTGMIGTPSFYSAAIVLRTKFNPAIEFGQQVKVESIITPACGIWEVFKLTYELESATPRGKWFQTIEGLPKGPQAQAS